jgi:hypothetical protein
MIVTTVLALAVAGCGPANDGTPGYADDHRSDIPPGVPDHTCTHQCRHRRSKGCDDQGATEADREAEAGENHCQAEAQADHEETAGRR